jgi:hypothetical protein
MEESKTQPEVEQSCCQPYRDLIRFFMSDDNRPETRKRMGDVALALFEGHVNQLTPVTAEVATTDGH